MKTYRLKVTCQLCVCVCVCVCFRVFFFCVGLNLFVRYSERHCGCVCVRAGLYASPTLSEHPTLPEFKTIAKHRTRSPEPPSLAEVQPEHQTLADTQPEHPSTISNHNI